MSVVQQVIEKFAVLLARLLGDDHQSRCQVPSAFHPEFGYVPMEILSEFDYSMLMTLNPGNDECPSLTTQADV
ncbi:hypothetical protein P2G88_07470 [Aliiglaciecola sp. CAU 1673]|uniref:hypothetical protein n=1 Tax=Aliiglaciecola sp. CAU 1673 TaxID=3032595 RepID=UPI0023DA3E35|nr:hypothetical protein [Aliiglaciecola sp. CAU 1673]MDF2178090.1 hypothetical protein [Aliiglaciecola sp. CAU 1673]